MSRVMALIILLIPVLLSSYGIKLMRDMVFGILLFPFPYLWLQFISGILLFLSGLGFVAGFILYKDRKHNKVQDRFKK
ncbi:DUF2627 domain-containing protein [Bacillus sp. 03113]|uniref:DUF2627 domain-containing protein n=1 Tax=Bacillus sp. 03113 TaxID=2578211 RepID=UPI00114456F3|nr:DUF2627 domain-containing protein [Bacillus sp. 03113]